jgi:hypothetical protein
MVLEMMIAVIMLMYTISFDLQLPALVTIHNPCSNIELVSPVYFGNGAVCPKLSEQQIDIGTEMNASFEIYATQDEFEGALLYKLQKYVESDNRCNMDTLAMETDKNEAKCVQLLVAWKVKDSKPFLYVVLVEHVKEFTWDEDALRKLYNKNHNRLKEYDDTESDKWLMDNNMVLKISFKLRGSKGNFELSISISEEERNDYMRPLCVNLERQVALKILILFVLIYVVSLVLQSPISLNIYNARQGINLTSPVYFMHGGKWHVVPRQKIDVNSVMRNHIEFDSGQDILEGALVYKIQRKYAESDESVQDESRSIHLLVAWRGEYTKGLYVRVFLVEHDNEFNWDEDKLRRLYQKYWYPLDAWVDFIGNNWLLDDTAVLTARVDVMNGGYKGDIVIYERKGVTVIERPLWIDAERWVSVMLVIFLILMCTISLTFHMPMNVIVHNQHSGIKLVSPICFCNGETYDEYSVERMDDGTVMKIGARFDLSQDKSEGILMCEVQRSESMETDYQSNTDTTSTEIIESTSKIMRFLATWEIKSPGRATIRIILAEHDSELALDGAKLAQLYNKVNDIPIGVYNWILKYDSIYKWAWLIHDNTVLEATDDVIYEKGLELKIAVTEGVRDENAEPALWIDPERQVSFLMLIYSLLIYIISLTLQSIMNVTMNNRCTNIELVSPAYFIKDTTYHMHLPQQVDSRSIMKAKLKAGISQDAFGGILLYLLQWKEDASTSIELLMIWGCKSSRLYSHVRLIEHENTLVWDKDKLKRLHNLYNSQYNINFNRREWFLNDGTKLKTECETSYGGLEMNITISEEKDLLSHKKPLWVDPKR